MIDYLTPPGNYAELLLAETNGEKETATVALLDAFADPKDPMHKVPTSWIAAVIRAIWDIK